MGVHEGLPGFYRGFTGGLCGFTGVYGGFFFVCCCFLFFAGSAALCCFSCFGCCCFLLLLRLLFGSPTVEPHPCRLTFQNVNNNSTIDETPLTSENVNNNFLYPEKKNILYPQKKRLLYPKKITLVFCIPKKDFCTPKKAHLGGQALPFVRMFYGSPSSYSWEDSCSVSHTIRQGGRRRTGRCVDALVVRFGPTQGSCGNSVRVARRRILCAS